MASFGLSVKDLASDELARLNDELDNKTYLPSVGQAGVLALVDHFTEKNLAGDTHKTASKLGARPTGLFAQFAQATSYAESDGSVILSIANPAVRQRLEGGVIEPGPGKTYLTIPAQAAAYGVAARQSGQEFSFQFVPDPDLGGVLRPALVALNAIEKPVGKPRKDGTRRKKVIKPSGIWYWLTKRVEQKGDPTVLPTGEEIVTAITNSIGEWFERFKKGK